MVNKADLGKIPPQDIETEKAVLGSLMIEPDSIHKVSNLINKGSFYSDDHRKIFDAINRLEIASKPIDLITVTRSLKELGTLEEVGGAIYITELTSHVASAAHIEHHAMIIQQLHIQREMIKISTETISEAYEEGADIEDLLNSLKRKISALEDSSLGSNTGMFQSDVFQKMIIEVEADCREHAKGKQPGITTGIYELNRATGGWRNGNLVIFASRPAVGKTSLALHFAKKAAKSGKWVNFYSLEMSAPDLQRIMVSGESGINRTILRDGLLEDKDWDTINALSANYEKLPIKWIDYAGLTANMIKSNTIRNRKAGKCDLIIIDYLQLIKPYDKRAIREQQISEISRTLKEVALSENIPVICLSQLNRAAANEKPEFHHLRESGAIEQDADVVIFPWKDKDLNYTLSIAKNRRGRVGPIIIYANDELTVFGDVQPNTSMVYDQDKTNNSAF